MTKDEQIIANLKKLKSVHNGSYGADIDRAIKTLEQEPCEDAVSREQAVKTVVDWYLDLLEGKETKDIVNLLDALPSVQPTRKTGKWKRMSDLPIEQDDRWKCSRCGNVIHCKSKMNLRTFFGWDARCGAKMEVEE